MAPLLLRSFLKSTGNKAQLFLFAGIIIASLNAGASHIVGGEISIAWVSGNTFHVKLNFYRDCNFGNAPFDTAVKVGIYDLVTNVNSSCFSMPLGSVTKLTLGDSCYTPPGLCVERGVFESDVNIPDNPNGYYLAFHRCCRNAIITNIFNPGTSGYSWYAEIPDPALHNSTPTFDVYPSGYWCVGNINISDLSATDVDGDSLVYSLVKPFNGSTATGATPLGACPDAAPYGTVTWAGGYSAASMLGAGSSLFINSQNGFISATPAILGTFVICVLVTEYRRSDGLKLGTVRRDIQYTSLVCTPKAAYPDTTICSGNSISMTATGGTSYSWAPSTGLSNPNIAKPVASPTVTTTYTVTITSGACTSTATVTLEVDAPPSVSASPPATICNGQSTSLSVNGTGTYIWSPSSGLSNPTIANPVATPSVTTTYTVTVTDSNGCKSITNTTVTVNSNPPVPHITKSVTGDTLYCSTDPSYISYQWYKDSVILPGATDTLLYIGTDSSYFTVLIKSADSCTNTTLYSRLLPIELLSFEAVYNGKTADLEWSTASEINNNFFTIEKTKNGIDFMPVIKVRGAGTCYHLSHYHASDDNPLQGVSAYRLKQTDYDGKYKYSSLVELVVRLTAKLDIVILKNNVIENTLQYFIASAGKPFNIEIEDRMGRMVFSKTSAESAGSINLSPFAHGIYIFRIYNSEGTSVRKFLF